MIKRSGALLLTLLYLVTATGFALNLHYCFSHIASVSINAPAKSCSKLMAGKMKCCQDRHIEVKVKDAHETQPSSFLTKIFPFQLPKLSFASVFVAVKQHLLESTFDKDPPDAPINGVIAFIKYCILRI
ncbi:HYC_CC_PP family protein [Mucilaginibacter sp.]|uniref:HYC_CC_PP family protein n=1 Tax=Mucilaginibacter sp. TaxID=1882438 RepID=UPI003D0DC668